MLRRTAAAMAALALAAACTGVGSEQGADQQPRETGTAPALAPRGGPSSPDPSPQSTETPLTDVDEPELASGLSDAASLPGEPALLALGDSLAAATGVPPREGFVWRVHRALAEELGQPYGMENLSAPGATSASLRDIQLPRAVAILAEREVDAVLLSVGGNDLLRLFAGVCGQGLDTPECATAIDSAVATYAANLDDILRGLRAAAPHANIVLLTVYNPFDFGFASPPEMVVAGATGALNAAAVKVAARHDVRVADGDSALRGRIAATTGMGAQQPDVHPTILGHDRLALVILDALRA